MTHLVARSGMSLLFGMVAICATAAQSEETATPPDAVPPPPPAIHAPLTIIQHGSSDGASPWTLRGEATPGEQGGKVENVIRFATGEEMNEISRQFRERLTDPEKRAALRAEQRAAQVSLHAGVGRIVGLDPATVQKLIDVLTDQQMERLDEMHLQSPTSLPDLQQHAEQTTQRMNALRDVLGEEKLERFFDFEKTQGERQWVDRLSARLAPADKLQPDQVDRLVALKLEQSQMYFADATSWRVFRRPMGPLPSIEDMQRESRRQTRIMNENSWRKRQLDNQVLEQKAAAFLTSTQLAELVELHAEEQDNLRRYVEAARSEAGLDRKIPDQPDEAEQTPKLIEAQLQVEVRLSVNREPTTVTRMVRNGESFTFEAAQGLIVEATPAMYEDEWVDVHMKYFEQGTTGRRRLSGGSISTAHARQPDGSLASSGSGGTVISGRKGYAVETTVSAKVL